MAGANGNTNPARELLKSARPGSNSMFNSSADPLLAQIMSLREGGLDANKLSNDEIVVNLEEDDGRLGVKEGRDVIDGITSQRNADYNLSIAEAYGKGKGSRRDITVVAGELQKQLGGEKPVSRQYIEQRLEEIRQRDPSRITYDVAANILKQSVTPRAARWTAGRIGENLSRALNVISFGNAGTNERDIGGERVFEDDKIDKFTSEIKDGVADVMLARGKRLEAASGQVQASQAILDQALAQYNQMLEMARAGNPQAALAAQGMARKVERLQGTHEALLAKARLDTLQLVDPENPEAAAEAAAQQGANEFRRFYGVK